MSKKAVGLALLGALVALLAGLVAQRWLVSPGETLDPPVATRPSAAPLEANDGAASPGPNAALPAPPSSLQDTEVDGELVLDAEGRFVPNARALVLFDYFLAASGEEPGDVIRARIVTHIRGALPAASAVEAEALLDRYLRYRERMRELTTSGTPPADLERRLQWIREERRRSFGPELAETLFGEEERVALLDLERRSILQDASLSPDAKAQRLEEIEARLPEDVRDARRRATAPKRVEEQVAALRIAGASEAEILALREQAFGPEAAQRLAALDHEREAWQLRVATYAALRDHLLADSTRSPDEQAAQLERLRAEHFDAQEQIRIRALDESRAASR
jgi:lipase chaperone LimK